MTGDDPGELTDVHLDEAASDDGRDHDRRIAPRRSLVDALTRSRAPGAVKPGSAAAARRLHFHPVTDPGGDRPDLPILPYERREAHVRAWDPRTVEVAARIAAMVRRRWPDLVVEHIGSTAVPGLPGKGIVDLSVEVEAANVPGVVEDLYGLGFGPQPGPDPWPATRPMLVGAVDLDGDVFRIHLHVQPLGGDMPRDLAFRDALRNDPELMRQYTALKTAITGGQSVDGYRYTHSKTTWILGVYKALGFRAPAIEPPATIGILGGGAMARLIGLAARELGYRIVVLDPDPDCPAAGVADRVEVGRHDDIDAARRLAAGCAVITQVLAHPSPDVATALDDGRVPIRPGPYALRLTKDRLSQRRFLEANGATVAARRAASIDTELAVIVARGVDGVTVGYPVGRTVHDNETLPETSAPAAIPTATADAAIALAADLATGMGLVGILTLELVLAADGSLMVESVAPRVREAGLWTVEGATTSQFEQHVRAICGLPLGPTSPRAGGAATVRERAVAGRRMMGLGIDEEVS
jgi:5-(carboxyamino)imidazole ribonucleotide synthase